jgi:hypothetical protein
MVNILLLIAVAYLFCGLVFAIAFVIKGVTRVDEGANGIPEFIHGIVFVNQYF